MEAGARLCESREQLVREALLSYICVVVVESSAAEVLCKRIQVRKSARKRLWRVRARGALWHKLVAEAAETACVAKCLSIGQHSFVGVKNLFLFSENMLFKDERNEHDCLVRERLSVQVALEGLREVLAERSPCNLTILLWQEMHALVWEDRQ